MMSERLAYRPAEAADAVGISRSKIYELVNRGEIPSIRVGGSLRIPRQALEEWITNQIKSRADRTVTA